MTLVDIISNGGLLCDGDWIEKKDQDVRGKVRLIQLADIGDGEFKDKSSKYITLETAERLHCTFLEKGDILIARLPEPLGRACIFPLEGAYITAVDIAILRIKDISINPQYIMYLINSSTFRSQIKQYESGTTRKRISRKNLEKIEFSLPNLEIQNRIVARIEELFSKLDKAVDTLKTTKEQLAVYRQAVLKKAFESKANASKAKLSSIGEICLGRQRSPKNISNEYPTKYIRAANITENGLKLDDILEMEFTPSERKKYYLKSGDIVVSEASGSAKQVGKPAIWKNEISKCCFQNTVIRLRLTADYSDYVFWYLKYLYLSGKIAKLVGGVGINHLGAKKFSDIEIPIIDLTAQLNVVQTIEKKMSQYDSVCETIDTALAQADAMRQSILKQAFEGKI